MVLPEHHRSSEQNPFIQSHLRTIEFKLRYHLLNPHPPNLRAFINHHNRRDTINLGNDSEVRVAFSTHYTHTLFV